MVKHFLYQRRMMIRTVRWEKVFKISHNGSRLCAGGDLEHESFNSAQKPNRITAVQFITDAPLAQNRCYKLAAVDYQ